MTQIPKKYIKSIYQPLAGQFHTTSLTPKTVHGIEVLADQFHTPLSRPTIQVNRPPQD